MLLSFRVSYRLRNQQARSCFAQKIWLVIFALALFSYMHLLAIHISRFNYGYECKTLLLSR
jgi:hypothetical protein